MGKVGNGKIFSTTLRFGSFDLKTRNDEIVFKHIQEKRCTFCMIGNSVDEIWDNERQNRF